MGELLDFEALVTSIREVDERLAVQASRAVNVSLTLRNWLFGQYIAEFELRGEDRARYGEKLLTELSRALRKFTISNTGRRQLYMYLSLYRTYPEFVRAVPAQLQTATSSSSPGDEKVRTVPAQLTVHREQLIHRLSYSHLEILCAIEDDLERTFYEAECLRGGWSTRELKRQIASLYFQRTGLSTDKQKLAELARAGAERYTPEFTIRDPYVFEFLGIKPQEVMHESDLEASLLRKLEDFLLELGRGFCFEARQRRILIGESFYFVDLVFYHRILKCHVLVELKVAEFTHEHLGQLNTYVSWYLKNEMTEGDNPPIGVLLCTQKDGPLVEYALAGMDNNLFVSKYQLNLPAKEEIQQFLESEIKGSES